MNKQRQEQTPQELNVPLFNALAKAYNTAQAVEKMGEEAYNVTVTGIAAFMRYDKLAFDVRASAVALAGIIVKETAYYSYLSRPRITAAISRLQAATAAAEDAARRAGKEVTPVTEYPHDVTAAQVLDSVEFAWDTINVFEATKENSAPARAKLSELQRVIRLNFIMSYNTPYILSEIADSFITSMKRVNATIKALHRVSQQALRRVQNAR